jgi:hypothetical protein
MSAIARSAALHRVSGSIRENALGRSLAKAVQVRAPAAAVRLGAPGTGLPAYVAVENIECAFGDLRCPIEGVGNTARDIAAKIFGGTAGSADFHIVGWSAGLVDARS